MPQGGHLLIEVGNRGRRRRRQMVFVRVTDDGEGMDAETLARCQEPFFTTKGRSRGIGLGLATVASILERSGGTLEIDQRRRARNVVHRPLPLAEEAGPAPVPASERAPAQVLLVDDDDQVRRFAARALTDGGYCVTGVSDGESAIRLIEATASSTSSSPTSTLPGISGLRGAPRRPRPPAGHGPPADHRLRRRRPRRHRRRRHDARPQAVHVRGSRAGRRVGRLRTPRRRVPVARAVRRRTQGSKR